MPKIIEFELVIKML